MLLKPRHFFLGTCKGPRGTKGSSDSVCFKRNVLKANYAPSLHKSQAKPRRLLWQQLISKGIVHYNVEF